ncbi:MAG: DUF397 domain-containing protein [Pseudonocardiaceae bacterium]
MSRYEIDLSRAVWRKASYSNGNGGNCVEVTDLDGGRRAVRDSRDPAGAVLTFTGTEWKAFTVALRNGEFA